MPEGKPDAQVLDGEIRLNFNKEHVQNLIQRYHENGGIKDSSCLKDSHFDLVVVEEEQGGNESLIIRVTDPWGSKFTIAASDKGKDVRGVQGGEASLGNCMDDLTIFTPSNANIAGIARFYEQVLDAPILHFNEEQEGGKCVVVSMGPYQTLTFKTRNEARKNDGVNMHVDLRDEPDNNPIDQKYYQSNYGPHISIYVRDIRGSYQRAEKVGVTYVNPRFSRKAYNEEEVVKDCMFRCLDIVDPENLEAGVIIRLEHEVRSVLKADGSMYKSCPFEEAPPFCTI